MAFVVPKNYYLSAVTSIHDNRFEYDISFDVLLAYEFSKYTERLQSLQGRTWDFFLSAGVNSAHAGIQGSPVYRQGFQLYVLFSPLHRKLPLRPLTKQTTLILFVMIYYGINTLFSFPPGVNAPLPSPPFAKYSPGLNPVTPVSSIQTICHWLRQLFICFQSLLVDK